MGIVVGKLPKMDLNQPPNEFGLDDPSPVVDLVYQSSASPLPESVTLPFSDDEDLSGARTPDFGIEDPLNLEDLVSALGPGFGALDANVCRPCFGSWVPDASRIEKVLPCAVTGMVMPKDPKIVPRSVQHVHDARGENFVVRWGVPVLVDDGTTRNSVWISCKSSGHLEAEQTAWKYFHA